MVPLVLDRDELMANIKVNLDAIDLEMSSWDLIASNLIERLDITLTKG